LIVHKAESFLSQLLAEDAILCYEILDIRLLFAIDPTGQRDQDELPTLKDHLSLIDAGLTHAYTEIER